MCWAEKNFVIQLIIKKEEKRKVSTITVCEMHKVMVKRKVI